MRKPFSLMAYAFHRPNGLIRAVAARQRRQNCHNGTWRFLLTTLRPATSSATVRRHLAAADRVATSAIIRPSFAALLNVFGSNGIRAIGSIWSAAANLAGSISDRFGTPT